MKKGPNPFQSNNFANAFFAIKDMQADYQNFNGAPITKPPPIPLKKPIQPNLQKSPIYKSSSLNKPQPKKEVKSKELGVKVQSSLAKEVFKIGAGKQFYNFVKFLKLNVLPCIDRVYELSLDHKKSQWEYNVFCDGIPATQIVQKPQISFAFNAQDIKQGQLGNCYFVAALASLAQHPWLLRQRIPKFKQSTPQSKSFEVNLFESGKFITMIVDNLFPNVYCRPVGNDISPMILEKAYAQSYGNYDVINLGHSNDALRDLTGATTVYLDFTDKSQLIHDLKDAFENQFPVVIASKTPKVHASLSPKHSYIVLGYQLIKNQIFLRLRDPRGLTKAMFPLPSELFTLPQLGIFWIDYKNLEESFEVITICKVKRDYSYFFKTFGKKDLAQNRGAIVLKPHSPMKIYASIHQKHKKFFDQSFSYDILRLLVSQISQGKQLEVIKTLKADFKAQQTCTLQIDLKAGKEYIIVGEIGHKKAKQTFPKQIFTLSVYSQREDCEFESLSGNLDLSPFLITYMRQNKDQFEQTSSQQGLHRSRGALFGYVCMLYENKSTKNVLQTIEYPNVKNVEISERKVKLGPGGSQLLMHAIGPQKNCSFQCSTSTKTVYS